MSTRSGFFLLGAVVALGVAALLAASFQKRATARSGASARTGPIRPMLPEPPFVRKWSQLAGDQASVVGVREGVVYYRSHDGVGALDLQTGLRRWSALSKQWIAAAALQGRTLYALSQTEKAAALVAVDLETQQPRTLARLGPSTSEVAVDSTHVYVLDGAATLRAYDPESGKVIWSRPLRPGKERGLSSARLAPTSNGLYVGLDDGEFGLDPKDGKVLWNRPCKYAALYPPLVVGGDVITQHDGLQRTSVRTGKVVWKAEEGYGDAVLVAGVVVCSGKKEFLGRSVTNGRVLWRLPLRDAGSSYGGADDAATVSDGESVWVLRNPVLCVTRGGRERWRRAEPFTGTPAYADRERLVTTDGERIFGYATGAIPPLPSSDPEKHSLAERLASQFEILDDAERKQLGKLAPFAFPPLLAR
jgi:outer membrane protein assembly factor BamB